MFNFFCKDTIKNILDFSTTDRRYWSHNFQLLNKLDDKGYLWEIVVWHNMQPNVGDAILIKIDYDAPKVAIIKKVFRSGGPYDMYFLHINIKGASKKFQKSKIGSKFIMDNYL